MQQPLTENQLILLREVAREGGRTTHQLTTVYKSDGGTFTVDAAGSGMRRLKNRGLVTFDSDTQSWHATPAGAAEVAPPEVATGPRTYVVLEEMTVGELYTLLTKSGISSDDKVYLPVGTPEARNTEHAYRQVAKDHYNHEDGEPTLVAVATKMFQPTAVRIQTRQTVSVGGG